MKLVRIFIKQDLRKDGTSLDLAFKTSTPLPDNVHAVGLVNMKEVGNVHLQATYFGDVVFDVTYNNATSEGPVFNVKYYSNSNLMDEFNNLNKEQFTDLFEKKFGITFNKALLASLKQRAYYKFFL